MTDKVFEKIVDNLKSFKILRFCPYLQNEPLLDKKLFDRIAYAWQNLNIRWVELSTNGTPLTQEKIKEMTTLFRKIPHELWLSFHGVNKESYEEMMGLPYGKGLEKALMLVEATQNSPLNVCIKGAGMPDSSNDYARTWFSREEYIAFWEDQFRKHGFKKKPEIYYFEFHNRAGHLKDQDFHFDAIIRENLSGFYCGRFNRWMHFLFTGEPILCCMDYHRETAFENTIENASILELRDSERFVELIEKGCGLRESEKDFICKRCVCPEW